MIDRGHDLPVAQEAKALGISRGSVYYLPRPVPADKSTWRHGAIISLSGTRKILKSNMATI